MEIQHVKQLTTLRNMKRSHEPITYVSDRSYHQPMTPPVSISLYSDNPQTPVNHSVYHNGYHTWCDNQGYMHGRVGGNVNVSTELTTLQYSDPRMGARNDTPNGFDSWIHNKGYMGGSAPGNVSGSTEWTTPPYSDGMMWTPDGAPSRKRMRIEHSYPPVDLHRPMLDVGSQVPWTRPEAELHTQRNQDQSVSMVSNALAQLSPESIRNLFGSEFRTTSETELRTPTNHDESFSKALDEFTQLSSDANGQVSFSDFWTRYVAKLPTPRNRDESMAMAVEAAIQLSPETKRRLLSSALWTRPEAGLGTSTLMVGESAPTNNFSPKLTIGLDEMSEEEDEDYPEGPTYLVALPLKPHPRIRAILKR